METNQNKCLSSKIGSERKIIGANDSQLLKVGNTSRKQASMQNLIVWNISKALEKNPHMDLKTGLKAAQERLERDAHNGNAEACQNPDEQNLVCAFLAWQQLGHTNSESLHQFIETKRNEEISFKANAAITKNPPKIFNATSSSINKHISNNFNVSRDVDSGYYGSYSKGPVVKLPVQQPKIIMRVENTSLRKCEKPCNKPCDKHSKTQPNPITSDKITAACCMDTECAKNLAAMDADTEKLRQRAAHLAKREAERVELLERAEAAWMDLEQGYQRRLRLATEKEDEMAAQITKVMQERNEHKENCKKLAEKLKEVGDLAEAERNKLKEVEKTVCARACARLKLSEEAAKGEAALAEQQCKAVQLERDLQFKEEQARRKLLTMDNETESARVLMHEAERALRAELSGLREQIGEVSALLLEVDESNKKIKEELDELRREKTGIVEDLDGCKAMCDSKMQKKVDELMKKRKQLDELKAKVLECKCKLPVDVAVEAKRTPSLAALCKCNSEEKFSDACSCTSLRSRLISSLLADLFSGLQSELGGVGVQMPCQMLKCLEDNHNWDRSSVIKTNLRNFFSKLLVGELDIAIATSIENYHAKWTGSACVDEVTMKPSPNEDLSQGWEQRALERRAQKLAEKLAEQLFEHRADELTARAKEIVKSGPPPCECNKKSPSKGRAAVMQCIVEPASPFTRLSDKNRASETPCNWSRTHQDVTQLKLQIEDLKKDFIKKEDLKLMEENIAKIVKKAAVSGNENKDNQNIQPKNTKKEMKETKNINIDEPLRSTTTNKAGTTKKKTLNTSSNPKKYQIHEKPTKQPKKYHYNQAYAVNMCMCGPQKPTKVLPGIQLNTDARPSKETVAQVASVKQTKPIDIKISLQDTDGIITNVPIESTCDSNCKCFQKMPSNTSIDKLLETLTKWKCDLGDPTTQPLNDVASNIIKTSFLSSNSKSILKNKQEIESIVDSPTVNCNNKDNEIATVTERPVRCDEKTNKIEVLNFNLPINTTSEYMGAINLEKSNEYVSTCVDTTESNAVTRKESAKNCSNESPIQSIRLALPECQNPPSHGVIEHPQTKDHTKVRVLNEHLYRKNKNTTDLNILTNSKSTKTVIPIENEHKIKKEIYNQTDLISSDLNKPQLYPNNFDYYIKFLGVTLAETDSQKITKKLITDDSKKSKTYLLSTYKYKEPYVENKKEEKKTEMTGLISELKKQLREDNAFNSVDKVEKCECNAKFEEFQRFMINIFSDQTKKVVLQQKDEALDSPSLKYTGQQLENCACCDSYNIDKNSRDLEVNAFSLLEDHLKQKLKEFKMCSCKSSCITPEEEENIFSAILKRVKEVISDCANEAKSSESGLTTDVSWKRAYGLLQEYLKIKIKRVQCSTLLNRNKDAVVPNILEKVCDLIENDFKRLKDLCKCKKNDETLPKKLVKEHLITSHADLPEKDANIPIKKYSNSGRVIPKQDSEMQIAFVEDISSQVSPCFGKGVRFSDAAAEANCIITLSKQNSTDSVVKTQTMSSQVPPDLGVSTKACGALEMNNKSEQTSDSNLTVVNNESPGIVYNTCDCLDNSKKKTASVPYKKPLKSREILNYFCTDMQNPKNVTPQQASLKCQSLNRLGVVKSLSSCEITEYNKNCDNSNKRQINYTKTTAKHPYFGCTIDCSCEEHFNHCICSKSMMQKHSHKISDNWKNVVANSNNCMQNNSYIMDSSHKKNNRDRNLSTYPSKIPEIDKQQNYVNNRETETKPNEKDVVLLLSVHTLDTSHQNTNTSPEITTLSPELDSEGSTSFEWFKSRQMIKSESKTSMTKFSRFRYDYEPINGSMKSCKSEVTTDTETTKLSQSCDCYKVPVCHVKMLVEDIERNILENKCTCDSVSKICPVHSKIFR